MEQDYFLSDGIQNAPWCGFHQRLNYAHNSARQISEHENNNNKARSHVFRFIRGMFSRLRGSKDSSEITLWEKSRNFLTITASSGEFFPLMQHASAPRHMKTMNPTPTTGNKTHKRRRGNIYFLKRCKMRSHRTCIQNSLVDKYYKGGIFAPSRIFPGFSFT